MKDLSNAISVLQKAGLGGQPIPPEYVVSLGVAVQASLPREYSVLLERCGLFSLPGESAIELYDPAIVLAYGVAIYNFEGMPPAKWPALPIGRFGSSGDDIGYLRCGHQFAPAIVVLEHEGPWLANSST